MMERRHDELENTDDVLDSWEDAGTGKVFFILWKSFHFFYFLVFLKFLKFFFAEIGKTNHGKAEKSSKNC